MSSGREILPGSIGSRLDAPTTSLVLIAALLLPHLVPAPLVQQIRAEAGREAHL
jgi:hypothetical protein